MSGPQNRRKPPKTRTTGYLRSNKPLDGTLRMPPKQASDATFVPRLGFKPSEGAIELSNIGRSLAEAPDEMAIFLDNNIWDHAMDPDLWPAILSRKRGVYVVPGVRLELEPWRLRYPEFIGCKAVSERQAPIELLEVPTDEVDRRALNHYVSLLLQRRRAFEYFAARYTELHGREPTRSERVEGVQKIFGERALLLAFKDGKEVTPDPRATDEYLVCAAAAHGLATGEPTVILTRDQDVLEQFYKLWWFLDTHYRAMLLADDYAADRMFYDHHPIPRTEFTQDQFELRDDEFLLDMGNDRMQRCLPQAFTFVSQECWLIQPDELTKLTFGAETNMHRLLKTKGQTAGRVSNRIGTRNLHAYLGATLLERVNPHIVTNCVGVVHDRALTVQDAVTIPLIDILYALHSKERFTRFEK